MRDMLLHTLGFSVHVALDDTDTFTDADADKMLDRIQNTESNRARPTMRNAYH